MQKVKTKRKNTGKTSASQRAATKAYEARLRSRGLKKVAIWLTPEQYDALTALRLRHGSMAALASVLFG